MSKIWERYYSDLFVRFNLINAIDLGEHEISIFRGKEEDAKWYRIACKRAQNLTALGWMLSNYRVPQKKRTIYASAGRIHWKEVTDDFQPRNPKEELAHWNKNFKKGLYGMDWIIDIDSPGDLQSAFETMKNISKEHPFKHSLLFSGGKGFHIRTQYENIPPEYRQPKRLLKLTMDLKKKYPLIDPSTVTPRQPVRIPYSIHSTGRVCFPLSGSGWTVREVLEASAPEKVMNMNLYNKRLYPNRKGNNRGLPLYFRGEPIW